MREPCSRIGARTIAFGVVGGEMPVGMSSPFVVLIPAFTVEECAAAARAAPALVSSGCVEMCCVGTRSAVLHDLLDDVIEDMGALHVVTTGHEAEDDACDYFMFAAGGAATSLFALVLSHPPLVARLQAIMDEMLA